MGAICQTSPRLKVWGMFFLDIKDNYAFLMLKFSSSAIAPRAKSRINGTVYPPQVVCRLLQAVAINDAQIRLQFITLKLDAKYFCP